MRIDGGGNNWIRRRLWLAAAAAIVAVAVPVSAGVAAPASSNSTSVWISAGLPADEGEALSFTISVYDMSTSTVTVRFRTQDGAAKAPDDYTSTSGKLTFVPGGSTQQTITVETVQDAIDEPVEALEVRLSHPVNASLGDSIATGGLTDDDFGPSLLTTTSAQLPDAFQPMPIGCAPGTYCPYWRPDWDPIFGVKTTAVTAKLTDAFGAGDSGRILEFWWQPSDSGEMVLVCKTTTDASGSARCYVNYPLTHPTGRYEVRFSGDTELGPNSASGQL